MASHPPGGQQDTFRHRITNVKLDPPTSDYDISLKILVDGHETHRLPPIKRGTPLSWDKMIPCDVHSSSLLELRVYEKHFFNLKRVGSIEYAVSTVVDQLEASFELSTKQFTVTLSFSSPDAAKQAPLAALAEAQEKEKKTRLLERLGPTRDALKAILDFGQAVSDLHPAAKIAFGMCTIAWDKLENQEQCDASVETLVIGLARMLPFTDQVEKAAKSPQFKKAVESMMNLIEDASRFVVEYKSDEGPVQGLRAVVGSKAQVQVQDLLDKFRDLKEEFDRGVGVHTLEKVDAVHEVLLTNTQQAMLSKLNPVGSARYASARACLPGTRTKIIKEIVDWSQQRDGSEGLLWMHGQAGLGKSSIATSVCQELDERKLLAGEFFCKRDSSERRDPQQVLTTIVYGLALRHSGYARFVADAISEDVGLCSSPINKQYDNLVKGPLAQTSRTLPPANLVVIVDALDECGTNESRRQLLAYLHLMSQLAPWLRIVVTSRPDPDILSFFEARATADYSERNVYEYYASDDIRLFVQHRMRNSQKSKLLPLDCTDLLTTHAHGLFIWAKTACEFILSSHQPKSRFDLVVGDTGLSQASSPIDALYTTAIEMSLGDGGADDVQCVQEYLGAIIVCSTRSPLSVATLCDLLGGQLDINTLQFVVNSLGSVLYIDHAQGGAVRVYHHSFTDYMISSAPSKFRVDIELQNTKLAHACLRTMLDGLRFNICGRETSHTPNSQISDLGTRVDTAISRHLQYSCLYWTSHLMKSKENEFTDILRVFLLRPTVLYWIEALSLLGKLDVAMVSALELSKWYQERDEMATWASDAYRFILAFYDPVSVCTPHLYVSALAFCPARTEFAQRLRGSFQNTLAVTRGEEENWSPWLRCISHPDCVNAIAISGDGRRIVSGSDDGTVRMWDADTGVALGDPLVGHSKRVWSVGFSPNGHRIVSGSSDHTVRLWDADTGRSLGNALVGHTDIVRSVTFSPDGRHVLSGSDDKTVRVWDGDTGAALGDPLVGHSDQVMSVAFSCDGRIASGSNDNTVILWDAATGAALGDPLIGHSSSVWSVGFSPDGRRIVSGSSDKTVRVWDADTGAALGDPLIGHSGNVYSVGFSPDGRRIVSGSTDRTVRVWDADTGKPLDNLLVGHSACVWSVGFSPNGRRIISGSEDKTVRVWDADASTTLDNPVVGHSDWVRSVGFSPDGRRIVSGSSDNTVRVWEADTGATLGDPLVGHLEYVYSVGFSPDGRRIVSGSGDNTVRVWDADTGAALGDPLIGHSGAVRSVGFSPDGRRIISGSEDKTVRMWDVEPGTALGDPLVGHSDTIQSVAFSPDGSRIASGSDDETLRLWDVGTAAPLGDPLVGHSGGVNSVGFSFDGRRLVSGSGDGTVRVWDVGTGKMVSEPFVNHLDSVRSVAFSRNGRRIVSGSDDYTVRVWDADTGAAVGDPLVGHSYYVTSVGFSPDGRRIVSGSSDKTVRVWDAAPMHPTTLPPNTSRMFNSLSSDGWVRDKDTDALLIWLPEGYRRPRLDNSLFVISRDVPGHVWIDSSRFVTGSDWASVYTP